MRKYFLKNDEDLILYSPNTQAIYNRETYEMRQ